MHENFIALDTEKRNRIINAAMREFAEQGFKNASTNEIKKNAGISKSLLFYYFSTKEDLFKFLYHYSMDFLVEGMKTYMDDLPADIFERCITIGLGRIRIAAQYPEMLNFTHNAARDDSKMVQEFLKIEQRQVEDELSVKVFEGVDLSKFKPDIDVQKALQIIWWVLESYALAMKKKTFDPGIIHDDRALETIMEEIKGYLIILKQSFYKEEYL